MSLLVLCRLLISVTSTSIFPPALLMLVSQSSSSWQWVCRHSLSWPSIGLCYVRVHLHLCGCSFSFHPNFLPSSIQLQYTDGFIFAWYWWRKRWRLQCPACSNTGWYDQVYVWSVLHAATIDPLVSKASTEIQYSGTNPSTTELLRDQPLFSNPINSHVNVTLKSWPLRNPYIYNVPLSPKTSYINTPKIERVTHKTESRQRYHASVFSSFTWMWGLQSVQFVFYMVFILCVAINAAQSFVPDTAKHYYGNSGF